MKKSLMLILLGIFGSCLVLEARNARAGEKFIRVDLLDVVQIQNGVESLTLSDRGDCLLSGERHGMLNGRIESYLGPISLHLYGGSGVKIPYADSHVHVTCDGRKLTAEIPQN